MAGLIILAAGESSRLGSPKQLLKYKGETLIRRSIRAGHDAGCKPVIVVLGAYSDLIEKSIITDDAIRTYNHGWKEGICSSIRTGVSQLLDMDPEEEETFIMLCDQPKVDGILIRKMIQEKRKTGKGMVACAYDGTFGVPVLYHKTYFSELLALKGNKGAKKILLSHPNEVATVPFPSGVIDIDTIDDYKALQ